jgi:membrane-bound lytic murein transglycosylase B
MLTRSAAIVVATLLSALPARAAFDDCLAGLRSSALSKGVSASTFDRATRGLEPDMSVIERMNNQPEFKTPIWDYLATLNDEEKVAEGQQMLRRHAATLAAAEARFGVDRHTIVAVWGVESDYGKSGGTMPLVQALATGACYAPRRQGFFRDELVSTLKIIERGDLEARDLKGSWAGAFGHTSRPAGSPPASASRTAGWPGSHSRPPCRHRPADRRD